MRQNLENQGVERSASDEARDSKPASNRHKCRHSCNDCGTSDPAAFYPYLKTRCKACHRERMRAHYKTDGYKARNAERQRERLKDEVESQKHRARIRLAYAIRSGEIERRIWCEDCGILGPTHGHHEDYSKPLEVVWLCRPCHAKRHDGYAKKAI